MLVVNRDMSWLKLCLYDVIFRRTYESDVDFLRGVFEVEAGPTHETSLLCASTESKIVSRR